jgi:hypothetical protein
MGHFARINDNGRVDGVIVINNEVLGEPEKTFPETEVLGQEFISDVLKLDGTWLQTSYNNNFRHNYASIGGEYVEDTDAFIPVQVYDSWILNETTYRWESPVPYPEDGLEYYWDERVAGWSEIDL